MENQTCPNCNKKVHKRNNKYCDKICYLSHTKIKNKLRFIQGQVKDNKTIKSHLIEDKGEVCDCCGQNNLWNGKILSLQVDHIDGNSDNNKPYNLRLLCPNCHTQTETFSNSKGVVKNTRRNKYLRKYKSN